MTDNNQNVRLHVKQNINEKNKSNEKIRKFDKKQNEIYCKNPFALIYKYRLVVLSFNMASLYFVISLAGLHKGTTKFVVIDHLAKRIMLFVHATKVIVNFATTDLCTLVISFDKFFHDIL